MYKTKNSINPKHKILVIPVNKNNVTYFILKFLKFNKLLRNF